jgi:hypothetical protein
MLFCKKEFILRENAAMFSLGLKGCGLSDPAVRAAMAFDEKQLEESLGSEGDYYSCFISYSSRDSAFASQLYDDLQKYSVRCWIAERDMRIGDPIRDRIHKVIRKREKLLLILSKSSVESSWVGNEVEKAFNEENDRGELIIFPVRIDDAVKSTEKAWAETIRMTRHIGDFSDWEHQDAYDRQSIYQAATGSSKESQRLIEQDNLIMPNKSIP